MQNVIDSGALLDGETKTNLLALLSYAHEASLGVAHLHSKSIIHGGLTAAACFLKAAHNQRGFIVKVGMNVPYTVI